MKFFQHFFISCCALSSLNIHTNSQRTFLDDLAFRPAFRRLRESFFGLQRSQDGDGAFQMLARMGKLQPQFPRNASFFCDVNGPGRRSETVPTSVHQLRPGDIDVIGAIGDSLTAGNGGMATNILQISVESKGVSSTIGGEKTWREFLTIPNILKEFNPDLYGYSTSEGLSIFKTSRFNVAELGAMSRDTPHMAKVLVKRILSDNRVQPQHWKLISLMIGSNDFCLDMCYHERPEKIIENHERDLLAVFRTLRDNLRRTMVNVILSPSIKVLVDFKGKPAECETLHHFECPCFFGFRYRKNHARYFKIMQDWNEKLIEVANRDEFHDRKDFTINIQPFLRKVEFPKLPNGLIDFSYMSIDCFHLSQKGYALMTNAFWNNMLEPEGKKTENLGQLLGAFNCPTETRPYLATRFN